MGPAALGLCGGCFRRYAIRPDGTVREHYAKPFATDGSKCSGGEKPPVQVQTIIHLVDPAAGWPSHRTPTLCCRTAPTNLPAWDRYSNDKNVATCAGKQPART